MVRAARYAHRSRVEKRAWCLVIGGKEGLLRYWLRPTGWLVIQKEMQQKKQQLWGWVMVRKIVSSLWGYIK